jgi:hypothetical protein
MWQINQKMKEDYKVMNATTVFEAPQAEALADILASCLTLFDWRHHGIGVLQAYINERDDGVERRLHIWHPDLVIPGIEDSGSVHDHRFDLTSIVLCGSVLHRVYQTTPNPEGNFEILTLVNARASKVGTGSFHSDPTPTGERFDVHTFDYKIDAGLGYTFGHGVFHSSTVDELAVTLVEKRNQEGSARLLANRCYPLKHAFGNPENITEFSRHLIEARQKLLLKSK